MWNDLPERAIGRAIDRFNSPEFVSCLSRLTGIEGLVADPLLEGGGMHRTARGGFLDVHADFTPTITSRPGGVD